MTLIVCLLVISLLGVCATALILNHQMQLKWMRAFLTQQGIPAKSMEVEREEQEIKTPLTAIPRRRITVPIPGAWRDTPKQVTKQ
jgi:hypothetical protein